MTKKPKLRKWLSLAIRSLLVVGLLTFLAQRGLLSLEGTKTAFFRWQYTLPAYGALALTAFLGIVRWRVLLNAQGIRLSLRRVSELAMVGIFFNIALPGAISGDVIKAFYVAKDAPGKRAYSLSSILFDRVVGVSALALVSFSAILLSGHQPWMGTLMNSLRSIVLLASVAVLAFYVLLLTVKESRDPIFRYLDSKQKNGKLQQSLFRIYHGIRSYHDERSAVFLSLSISFLIHLLVTFTCIEFTYALGDTQLHPLALAIIVPLGLFFTALPVMPAGVGTGHAAFLALYSLLGSQRGADVFNLYLIFQIAIGVVGGFVYLRFKGNQSTEQFLEEVQYS